MLLPKSLFLMLAIRCEKLAKNCKISLSKSDIFPRLISSTIIRLTSH